MAGGDAGARDAAERALALAAGDPRAGLVAADRVAAAARAGGDPIAESTAHRAAALALRELGDLAAAERRARAAVAAAVRDGNHGPAAGTDGTRGAMRDERARGPAARDAAARDGADGEAAAVEAQARMNLAYLLGARGRVRAALAQMDRADAAVHAGGLVAARLAAQRALILQEAGRLDEALAGYAGAVPALRRHGDRRWQAMALNNRGLAHAYRGRLAEAEADLRAARALFRELGLARSAADGDLNLGFVAARRGDAPAALEHYAAAEAAMQRLDVPIWRLLICRFEVLAAAGLTGEARAAAERAEELLGGTANAADLAEVRLLLAQVALAEGDAGRAGRDARAAAAAFRRQQRRGWALTARALALRADELAGGPPRRLRRTARETAEALSAAGWREAALDARIVAARAAVRVGDLGAATAELAPAAAARGRGPLDLRVRAWHATALLREAAGDRRGATAALRAGLGLVERFRAASGATDLRVHLSAHGAALASHGLGLALADGDPAAVLAWAERLRARTTGLRPVRPPEDPGLATALAELRRLSAATADARLAGRPAPPAGALRAAERAVVAAGRSVRAGLHRPAGPPPRPRDLAAAAGDAVVVEFVAHGGVLAAVTVRSRRTRLHALGPLAAVADQVAAAQFALRRLVHGGTATALPRAAAARAAAALDALLLGPLRAELGDRPLVLVPTGDLHAVPWGLLPGTAARPVRVVPSAAAFLAAASPPAGPGGRVVVAAGPGLPAAPAEARAVQARYPAATLLDGADATAGAVLAALDGAALAHVAAHGTLRVDNPLFSALELADGPLTAYELEGLAAPPRIVVLPSCHSGRSAVRTGDEVLGLVAVLLALGARTVVAPVLPVADAAAADLMVELHRRLAAGSPPSDALAAAAAAVNPADVAAAATAAAFSCFGA